MNEVAFQLSGRQTVQTVTTVEQPAISQKTYAFVRNMALKNAKETQALLEEAKCNAADSRRVRIASVETTEGILQQMDILIREKMLLEASLKVREAELQESNELVKTLRRQNEEINKKLAAYEKAFQAIETACIQLNGPPSSTAEPRISIPDYFRWKTHIPEFKKLESECQSAIEMITEFRKGKGILES